MEFASVDAAMRISPTPPNAPGVYVLLSREDEVMYVGMARNLEKVLYRYQKNTGRQAMRDRAALGEIARVAWVRCTTSRTPPSLEQLAIRRYRPPWNTQHNPRPRSPSEAVSLSDEEQRWLEEAARSLDTEIERLLAFDGE